MAVHKKYEGTKEPSFTKASTFANASADKSAGKEEKPKEEVQPESIVVSDTVTETTERIEIIEGVTPDSKPETETPAEDLLTDFKEKMSEEEQASSFAPPKKNFMWPVLFVFIIALAMLGGIFIYKQGMNKGTEVNVVTLSPTPTLIPIPTVAEIDLSKHKIKILNGSEVEGEAGRKKSALEEKGFTVSSVGNAQNSDYTKTIIQAKENVDKDFLDKLKSVLKESLVVGEIEELPEDADSDIIIIIGSKNN